MEITYHVMVLIVATFALIRGWRRGLLHQTGSVLGLAFGAVVARIFKDPASAFFMSMHLWPLDNIAAEFASQLLGCSSIFALTYFALWCFGSLLSAAMSLIQTGVLNSIFGAIICTVKYLLLLSIFFNLAIASNPQSVLMKYACDDDGNMVEGVMFIAPFATGCQNYRDLAHKVQLQEAKKISYLPFHSSMPYLKIEITNLTATLART
ncbi:MAG: CvpA family protein [Prevotella sp.]|nr:CvpA family protein [Bacteroides sp.]MCM1366589.1 CvpA family protein [Prevotella sp.]MCM1437258.1 CvpA family protein [Prevotella sp.]